jgi:Calcium-dependent channel, 7TM region, putative phosphate
MIITAFSGTSLATMVINGFSAGYLDFQVQEVLAQIASAIPTQISAQWINWIIIRIGVTLPLHYMLQFNTFLFSCFGWKCCSRLVRGGGPGGPVPYRVYVDSGVVLLCVVALAPASPLLAPFALIHYAYCEPVLRRNLIFVYRPNFDGGGIRWPFLFDVIMSSLLLGHILMVVMLTLKKALGPAIVAAIPFIPTILFRAEVRREFLRSYLDAALLQTSMLDGWDIQEPTSMKKREDFRKFLVDSHKAAYIPVCIAGRDDMMTAEPAAVISHDNDEGHPAMFEPRVKTRAVSASSESSSQFGVAMRRVPPRTLERSRETRELNINDDENRHFSFSAVDHINEEYVGDCDDDDHKS